ncbi:MAG: radical SAM family heme chaperone HemW [Robiginitomaculum sp.]|nr:radical SAM family heme chaperone HemW [Robiginitomaculum sp.]
MDEIALYIHWPYCARICPYCDFNVYKNKPDTTRNLVAAILADMQYWRQLSGPRRLVSIHFGGGTPSLLPAKNLRQIISQARQLWNAAESLEIGLEANPKDINKQVLRDWKLAGIERLSIGVQSFDDYALKFLGRDHDAAAARKALEAAQTEIPRVSADLIYGWAGQTLDMLHKDLRIAVQSGVSHISAYQLTIEPGTAFGRAGIRGINKAVNSDHSADFFELATDTLSAAGFEKYEVSNFAKNNANRSRHNLVYWQGGDYAGVGPGAHGRLTARGVRTATIATLKPKDYISAVDETGYAIKERETLDAKAWAEEYVLMGLRISSGISLSRYKQISGHGLAPERIAEFERAGLLVTSKDKLSATVQGSLVLDTVCRELLS